jgi:hypothetical protein
MFNTQIPDIYSINIDFNANKQMNIASYHSELFKGFYLRGEKWRQKRWRKKNKSARNSFIRYLNNELHYLDEFDFYRNLHLHQCHVKFDRDWGHIHDGECHSGIVVGERNGTPVVWVDSWKTGASRTVHSKAYQLKTVFIFNPKYSYNWGNDDIIKHYSVEEVADRLILHRRYLKNIKNALNALIIAR